MASSSPRSEIRQLAVEVHPAGIKAHDAERTLLISAEQRSQRQLAAHGAEADATANVALAPGEQAGAPQATTRLSEVRHGTWSRSFRFPVAIEREPLQAVHRDGLLTVTVLTLLTLGP